MLLVKLELLNLQELLFRSLEADEHLNSEGLY